MIGIDTNILLCIFETEDDPAQSSRARKVIEEHAPVFLHDVVLAEFVWTCRNAFKPSREAIRRRLQAIADSTEFVVARPEVFARAVEAYGSQKSDFADWLVGLSNLHSGLEFTFTFDKSVARRRAFGVIEAWEKDFTTHGEEVSRRLHYMLALLTVASIRKAG